MIFNTPFNKKSNDDKFTNKDIILKAKKRRCKIKYPCGNCTKKVIVDAINCDNCKLWYHRK